MPGDRFGDRAVLPRVLFVVAELAPWVKTGGLGDVAATLPAALRGLGVDVHILIPAYPAVQAALGAAPVVAELPALGGDYPPARLLAGATPTGMPILALDCAPLYSREGGPYGRDGEQDWPDNYLRFGLLSNVAAQVALGLPGLDWSPDVLHCNDWHTGLAPVFLQLRRAARVRSVFTIHNIGYQGVFSHATLAQLALPQHWFTIDGFEFHGCLSFLKAGIRYADAVTTVSPTHAREIQSDELGFGLGGLLRRRAAVLSGILNGLDTAEWNPATDAHLARRYDSINLDAKGLNKTALQRKVGLPTNDEVPLFGVVGRFTHQKGLDLLAAIAHDVLDMPAQLVLLGAGAGALEQEFSALARSRRDRCAVIIGFDEPLAHQIEAGADIFVMPSRYEPCGLNQMYSLRYGTPPVARCTGGIADTVVDCNSANLSAGTANGFVFEDPTPQALLAALGRAADTWKDKSRWRELQRNGMHLDFSWRLSARRYLDLYLTLIAMT